jgi:hypothetical protein
MSKESSTAEIFEAFQKMINPMAFPMQNLLMGAMKPEEIEKKIAELETVKHWLSTNIGMLDLTIKTLEYQRQLLSPGHSAKSESTPVENPFLNPALWPWPYQQGSAAAGDKTSGDAPADGKPGARKGRSGS